MGYGGFHPYPRRFGQGKPFFKVVHEQLAAARGTAVDASTPGNVAYIETYAYAKAITFDGYGVAERLANQSDPRRMTSLLSRWEAIFKITPTPTATDADRRIAVLHRFQRFFQASALHSRIYQILTEEIPDYFIAIEYIDQSIATIYVPDASYPWGTVFAGRPWNSTVAHLLILVQKPAGATEADFFREVGKIVPLLDGVLPAWMSVNWYRAPAGGPPINVSGGPSRAGFYLDDPFNLDNCVFAH